MLPSLWLPTATAISIPSLLFLFLLSSLSPFQFAIFATVLVVHIVSPFLSNVSSCCLLIPQAGSAHLECIILIGPGEGDRSEGLLLGLRGGGVPREKLLDNPSLYCESCLSDIVREPGVFDDSSPTKQPTTITGHLICLTTIHNPSLTGSKSNQ